ncbi:MAG: hypothetical protein WBZ36_02645 [Candidatus Nitrosopolaris sp.]
MHSKVVKLRTKFDDNRMRLPKLTAPTHSELETCGFKRIDPFLVVSQTFNNTGAYGYTYLHFNIA